jgi:hypothetical protein
MAVALFYFMKPLYLQLIDPCGQKRCLTLRHFPLTLGTDIQHKNQLRDQSLKKEALLIERKSEGDFSLRVLQEGVTLNMGDLHFSSIELPFGVSLNLGDTELNFALSETKDTAIEFPDGVQAWYTESKNGIELLKSVRKASQTKLSIYLSGDTGTGKEVLAPLVRAFVGRVCSDQLRSARSIPRRERIVWSCQRVFYRRGERSSRSTFTSAWWNALFR